MVKIYKKFKIQLFLIKKFITITRRQKSLFQKSELKE